VGTDGGGLCRMADGKIQTFGKKDGLTSDIVPALLEDRRGRLWVGTTGGGILRYEGGRFDHYSNPQNLATQTVHLLYEDREGTIWAGTNQGLGRLEGGRFRIITKEDGLSSNVISAILESPRGGYWIGTIGGGLNLMRNGKISTISRRDGLFDDVIYAILDDGQGNLWMSCNRGVFFAKERDLFDFAMGRSSSVSCESFGRSDGMKSGECNGGFTPAGCILPDGTLCFPTIRGVAEIGPSGIKSRLEPPPVMIESVICDHADLSAPKALDLPPGSPQLEIHYTALSFLSPEKVLFRYRLEGFDKEWVDAGTRRVAFYTNLPPGSYTFRVIACNSEGVWNKTGAFIAIEQEPHLYQSALFYLLVALGLVLFGALSYHIRVRSMRTRQKRLELVVEERTHALQEANRSLAQRSLQLERLNLELERLSALDGLTGVANRRCFDERLDTEWRRARRSGNPLSLVLLDVDYFKAFNDSYGHQQGDLCLKRVASFLVDSFNRAGDLVARLGGDEFCVILASTNREEALAQAEKLRSGLEALAIPHEHSPASSSVTTSVGVASSPPKEGLEAEDLMSAADHALYAAKNAGRNTVRFRETKRSLSSKRSELGR
jgi:diguanylate cyclase (GGDEF)-like protein